VALLVILACPHALPPACALADVPFTQITIDSGKAPQGECIADLDRDGYPDIVVTGGFVLGTNVYWYQYPSWTRFQIGSVGGDDGLQAADINADGEVDLVVNYSPTVWYENPRGTGGNPQDTWASRAIDLGAGSHDLAVADVNADGKLDVLTRASNGPTYLYIQVNPTSWTRIPMPNAELARSGSALADINRDGRIDIVGNGYWLEQPTNPVSGTWVKHTIVAFPSCSVAVNDVNGDGRLDVSLATSESGVGTVEWFEAPLDPVNGTWIRHTIDVAEDVHGHHLVDADHDGDVDLVFAEMHQSRTRRVGIYWNQGAGSSFTLQVLATTGAHNIAVGDVDSDGDIDLLGANWDPGAPDGGDLHLWRNDLTPTGVPTPEQEENGPIRILSLGCNPNPFRDQAQITFHVEGGRGGGSLSLRIYDVYGRVVRTLLRTSWPGSSSISWNALTDSGKRVGAGVYYYQLEVGGKRLTRRLVLLK
jgi:hypothetical protein